MWWKNRKRNKWRWIVAGPVMLIGPLKMIFKHDAYAHWYMIGIVAFYMIYVPIVGRIIARFWPGTIGLTDD